MSGSDSQSPTLSPSSISSWNFGADSNYSAPVLFESIADQYAKGDDITVFFTISDGVSVNPDEDQIGLTRIGVFNVKDCVAYAPVQITPPTSEGSMRHGTATFSEAVLPTIDNEFYQFCYISNKKKSLSCSLPFQLNCSAQDMNLLSSEVNSLGKGDGFITVNDQEQEDVVVVHTRRMLVEEKLRQENRQLTEMKRRLEGQNNELQMRLDSLQTKTNDSVGKVTTDLETLTETWRKTSDELAATKQSEEKLIEELKECRTLSERYQKDSVEQTERCLSLEKVQEKTLAEMEQIRNQWTAAIGITTEQGSKIVELQRQTEEAEVKSKSSEEREAAMERKFNEYRVNSEKQQSTLESQIKSQNEQIEQQEKIIENFVTTNETMKQEIEALVEKNRELIIALDEQKEKNQSLEEKLGLQEEQFQFQNDATKKEIEQLKTDLAEMTAIQESNRGLMLSVSGMKDLCLKHQKNELESKKQLGVYRQFVDDLRNEVQQLTERLEKGAEEYRTLSRKYAMLERQEKMDQIEEEPKKIVPVEKQEDDLTKLLQNSAPGGNDQDFNSRSSRYASMVAENNDNKCPICHWEFPSHMTFENKTEHVEDHFQH